MDPLENLIRARYPLLQVLTWEEERAEGALSDIARRLNKTVYRWSSSSGIKDSNGHGDANLTDPKKALAALSGLSQQGLFIFRDIHPFFTDPTVVRYVREIAQRFKTTRQTLVFISPTLNVPVELDKEVTVFDFDLPEAEDLGKVLDVAVSSAKQNKQYEVTLTEEERDRLIQASIGLTVSEMENVLAKAIITHGCLDVRAVDLIFEETRQIVRKSRVLEYFESREEFSRIGGLEEIKRWLVERGRSFSPKAKAYGLPAPRGMLILGVQGCGKSLACKAIAGLWKMPLLRLDMGALFGGFIGQSEENMRRAIKTAESVAPCVLWLDEIEKGLAGSTSSGYSDAGTTSRVFSTFLTWLQEKTKPVFVAATANNIQALPPELFRRGRLDEIFFVDLPSLEERASIFSIHIKKYKRDPSAYDLASLAASTEGYSGAEIEQIVISALHGAFGQEREPTQQDLGDAVGRMVPLSRTMREEIESLRQWARDRTRPASASHGPR